MSKAVYHISLLLIVLANISPVLAVSKSQNTASAQQTLDHQIKSQPIIVAGFGNIIKDINRGVRTIDRIERQRDAARKREEQRKLRQERREQEKIRSEMRQREREQRLRERQAREEERKRRQEELAAARRAATERQIREAEIRRQYFNSLSPAQKQAYIKKQQEIRQKQVAANLLILGLFAEFLIGSNGENSSQQQTPKYRYRENNTPIPTNNSTPAPVKPNHPNYGSCHHYSC